MISVIIPTYNNATFLDQCLAGVFAQTFKNIEVIVVDDGSSNPDDVIAVISKYTGIQLIQQKNHGAPHARNTGFNASKGDEVIFLDSDAVMHPSMLQVLHDALTDSDAGYAYSQFKHGHKVFRSHEFDSELLSRQNYIHTSALIRRTVFPGFDESLKKFQDWDLWLTLAKNGHSGIFINQILFRVVDTHGTMSRWLPSFLYAVPWPIFGYTPKAISRYEHAKQIIVKKHNL